VHNFHLQCTLPDVGLRAREGSESVTEEAAAGGADDAPRPPERVGAGEEAGNEHHVWGFREVFSGDKVRPQEGPIKHPTTGAAACIVPRGRLSAGHLRQAVLQRIQRLVPLVTPRVYVRRSMVRQACRAACLSSQIQNGRSRAPAARPAACMLGQGAPVPSVAPAAPAELRFRWLSSARDPNPGALCDAHAARVRDHARTVCAPPRPRARVPLRRRCRVGPRPIPAASRIDRYRQIRRD